MPERSRQGWRWEEVRGGWAQAAAVMADGLACGEYGDNSESMAGQQR